MLISPYTPKFWHASSPPFIIGSFIEVIHDILTPPREGVEVVIEAHIAPVDDEVIIRVLCLRPTDIVRHHDRVALLFGNLVNPLDIFLDFISEVLS